MPNELDPSVYDGIKKAISEALPKIEKTDDLKFSAAELSAHQEDCDNPNCPACQGMFKKINSEKISHLANRVENLIEKKKFSEINRPRYEACVKKFQMKCEKKYAQAGRLQRARYNIGKRIAGIK